LPDLLVIRRYLASELADGFIQCSFRRKPTDLCLNHALVDPLLDKTHVLDR
jgi:hypothetical protein